MISKRRRAYVFAERVLELIESAQADMSPEEREERRAKASAVVSRVLARRAAERMVRRTCKRGAHWEH